MPLATYCEFNEVRSALGVNELELKDSVLALPVYEMGLVRELRKLSTSLGAAFSSIAGKSSASRTAEEEALYKATRLFSVYAVAKQVGVSLPSFAPKDVGDGKSNVSRFAGDPMEKTLARVNEYYESMRVDLIEAYQSYSPAATSVTAGSAASRSFRAAGRSYDPVTGA